MCGSVMDTIVVEVVDFQMSVSPDTTICFGDEALLVAYNGISYDWTPTSSKTSQTEDSIWVSPLDDQMYQVVGYDENACSDTAYVRVTVLDLPSILMGPDLYAFEGDTVQLSATGDGVIEWQASPFLSCLQCETPNAFPPRDMTFTAFVTDVNGCRNSGSVDVQYDPLIYVPNVFTPGGDGRNDEFVIHGSNIQDYHLMIFNRWGELIYESYQLGDNWDGKYNSVVVQNDVYVWKINYTDFRGNEKTLYGHVTAIR